MNATIPTSRRIGDIDPSFGTGGVFPVQLQGYDFVEPGEIDTVRGLDRAVDGSYYMLALAFRAATDWVYGLMRLKSNGVLDEAFGNEGVVIGSLPREQRMMGAQPWITREGKTVVVLRDQLSLSWSLACHGPDGALDPTFGTDGYVDLGAIRPAGEPVVVKGFVIGGPGDTFYFLGSVQRNEQRVVEGRTAPDAARRRTDGGSVDAGNYVGAIVFRFHASGQLDTRFANGTGYAYVDVPLNPSGRITDAVLQGEDEGKLVLSTVSTSGNARIMRLLGSTGELDPDFGTAGVFVVEGDSAERTEIEKLAWSPQAGLWGVGRTMNRSHKGLLIALDDQGRIREGFNGGSLMEIDYGATAVGGDGFTIPIHIQASGDGVTVAGGPRRPYGTEPKVLIVGRHRPSGALDPLFGEADETGTRKGFYTVKLDRPGLNFFYLGIDLDSERLTLELLNGDGVIGTPNLDRTTVERYVVSQGQP